VENNVSKKSQNNQKAYTEKTPESDYPFNDIFFWLSIATADFSFGLYKNGEQSKENSSKQIRTEKKRKNNT